MTTTTEETGTFTIFAVWAISIGSAMTRTWRLAARDTRTGQEWDVAWTAIRGTSQDRFGEAIRDGIFAVDASLDRGEPIGTVSLPVLFSVYNDSVDDFFAGIEGRYDVTIRSKYLNWMERSPEDYVIGQGVVADV